MMGFSDNRGFTLTELLVAMAISGVVMGAIYSSYYSQQKSFVTQDQVAMMQQNLRAALYYTEREIRMAGFDPTGTAGAGIESASADSINFTMDLDEDGNTSGTNEDVTYTLDTIDKQLVRNVGAGNRTVAEDIDALDFVYLDEDGNETATISNIRSVQISVVARTGRGDPGYVDSDAYYNQVDSISPILPAQNDNRRRRLLTSQVKCRNLGLE